MQNGFYFADSVKYSAAAVSLLATGDFGEKYTRPPVIRYSSPGLRRVWREDFSRTGSLIFQFDLSEVADQFAFCS